MKIQKAKKKQLREIAELMLKEFAKPPYSQKESIEEVIKSLKFYFKLGEIYIYVKNKEILGVILIKKELYWEGPTILIEEFVVKKNSQNYGIGTKLIKFVEDKYIKKGYTQFKLMTNRKTSAFDFYKKRKYKLDKDMVSMTKKIK